MSKPVIDLRLGVRSAFGQESLIWRLIGKRNGDVYFAIRSHAGVAKYSFHRSGICRSAFTKEHGTPQTLPDRLMFKWKRAALGPPGQGRLARVLLLAVPTDFLSAPKSTVTKITWLEAAPPGGATYLSLGFTAEPRDVVERAYRHKGTRLISHVPAGDAYFVADYYHADWQKDDVHMPGEGQVNDLVFSAQDPNGTGRPIRLVFGATPKDGDALHIRELGGYAVMRPVVGG